MLAQPMVHRIEVRPKSGRDDPRARSVREQAGAAGVTLAEVRTAKVYLIEAPLTPEQLGAVRDRLLSDPVTETASAGATPAQGAQIIEVHPLPGVMDPAAQSVQQAIGDLVGVEAHVSTGWRYDLVASRNGDQGSLDAPTAAELARRNFANPAIHAIHTTPFHPDHLPRGRPYEFRVTHVPVRDLSDDQLQKLSREAHLFLSLGEMQAIREEYRSLGRDPTDIELETLAQTWSEHCVHKTLKSKVNYRSDLGAADLIRWKGRPGHTVNADGSVTIDNLLKSTVAAATFELIDEGVDWALSVFKDNSGVVALDDEWGVNIKVETHNRPSAIEPYGGAATGAGGCIRDVIGTGLGARPIANTDVFCVALPGSFTSADPANSDITINFTSDAAPVQAEGTVDGHRFCFRARHQDWTLDIALKADVDPTGFADTVPGVNWHAEGTYVSAASPPTQRDQFAASYMPLDVAEKIIREQCARAKATNYSRSDTELLPPGTLHPRRILTDIVAGVRDYGNRMGIPTLSGAVYFDDRYVGNPLVYCGCVGLIPRRLIAGEAEPGDRIIALGGRTGRDGIHGATFSSAGLESTTATEFAHAVQIGNAIEERRLLEAILRARDEEHRPLYNAITDCGAGGFSSAVGEMGSKLGAEVHLEHAPLKYAGLSYTEIWISEAQERMILAVPPENVDRLRRICREEHVELADLGHFGTPGAELVLRYQGHEVGRLPMEFIHDGLPQPVREAAWDAGEVSRSSAAGGPAAPSAGSLKRSIGQTLLALLSHPNIASKHWIIRQYDHEVQGNTVLKPLTGPGTRGPSDAAVLEPVAGTGRGIAISQGLQTGVGDPALGGDPYLMALAAIDECVRNLVCVGADPDRIAILDNFCWPSCSVPRNLGSLVRAAEGCYDGAKAYRTPFVSGKDSLNNQLRFKDPATGRERTIEIPPTLLITGIGIVPDLRNVITMDAKDPGNVLILVGGTDASLGGSHFQRVAGAPTTAGGGPGDAAVPRTDLLRAPAAARAVHRLIKSGIVRSAHDISDGGLLCAVAEMLIGGATAGAPIGAQLDLSRVYADPIVAAFSETPGRYVLEIRAADLDRAAAELGEAPWSRIGELTANDRLRWMGGRVDEQVEALAAAWMRPLNW